MKKLLLAYVFAVGLGSNFAFAQPLVKLGKNVIITPAASEVKARAVGIISAQDVATDYELKNAALSSFVFNFNNGDHSINTIQLLQKNGGAEVEFADQDENDPYEFNARWIKHPSIEVKEVSRAVRGPIEIIALPTPPVGYTIALAGFSFTRPKTHDGNIIGAKIDIENNSQIKVYFESGHGANIGRNIGLSPRSDWAGLFRDSDSYAFKNNAELANYLTANRTDFGSSWPYFVRVQYALIPNTLIASKGSVSGSGRVIGSGTPPTAGKPVILTGFSFEFLNGDHHLLQIGVNLKPDRISPSVFFQDNNQDDPIAWKVSYLGLK